MTTPAKFIAIASLATGIFVAGYSANRREPVSSPASGAQAVAYTCPMHPQYTSSRAGDCPICGMRLTRADTGEGGNKLNALSPDTRGKVQISAAKQQLIGVRTDEVGLASSSHLLRVPGRIAVDDQRLHRIIAAADGWIVDLGPNTVGSFVRKNQFLASYYQKDLLYNERLFLLSIPANQALPGQTTDLTQASIRTSGSANPLFPIDSLRGLGMSDLQIEEIHRTGQASPHVGVYSPVSGFVLARNISPSQRFEKGTELYRIADISRVWVMTDIFEKDREFLRPGATATVRYRGREFQARLSDALPQLDPQTRTLRTRFELDNRDHLLQPDMFVDVELHVEMPAALVAPADAVIDQGRRKTVYVATAGGVFEARNVETGWRLGNRVQITGGLEPGEHIVVSGNFMIDSESRMQIPDRPASSSPVMAAAEKDPVCGMDVDLHAPNAIKIQHGGKTWYFCSDKCRKDFEADPAKYTRSRMQPSGGMTSESPATKAAEKDPVCGMDVDPQAPNAIKIQHRGKTWYFCSDQCRKKFVADPAKYAPKTTSAWDNGGKRKPA
jgi:membrane fusion protein, copper/silver efflux system